jgi:3-dehydrosphinganine reductase
MAKEKLIEKQPFKGKNAIICGGSQGIGKATAREILLLGGNVCIIARREEILQETADKLNKFKHKESQFIETISCDATDKEKLQPLIEKFINQHDVPNLLINCVGYAYPEYIQNLKFRNFKKNMEVNYYGQLVPTLILLPYFLERKKGHIGFVSSVSGYLGLIGYTSYTPTKFAIRGLADALRHELKPYNINISVIYPPDTQTPGFDEENKSKPEELRMISEGGGILSPEEVAEEFIQGILNEKFEIFPGEAKFIWRMVRHVPKLVRWIVDRDYRKARKKLGKAE